MMLFVAMLLTFVAVLADRDPAEALPAHRAGLYRRYLEELLDSWEGARRAQAGAAELAVGPLWGEAARAARQVSGGERVTPLSAAGPQVQRLGEAQPRPAEVKLIAATNAASPGSSCCNPGPRGHFTRL